MQATRKQVFLVDVVQLDVNSDDWYQLGRQIFNNMEILKLGTFDSSWLYSRDASKRLQLQVVIVP